MNIKIISLIVETTEIKNTSIKFVSMLLLLIPLSFGSRADITSMLGKEIRIVNRLSGKALAVANSSRSDGAQVLQYGIGNGIDQQWVIEPLASNQYRIVNINSGRALEVADQGLENGDLIQQSGFSNASHQLWQIEEVDGNYFRIINVNSGKALEIKDGLTTDGIEARQWDYFPVPHHQWSISGVKSQGNTISLQAESATSITGGEVRDDSSAQSGRFFAMQGDGTLRFEFPISGSGKYPLSIRYRAPFGDKTQNIKVNDGNAVQQVFSSQNDWTNLTVEVDLVDGQNAIEISPNWGWIDIDQISLVAEDGPDTNPNPVDETFVESELAALTGDTDIVDDTGASGGKYVSILSSASVTFTTTVDQAGTYELIFGYQSPYGDKPQSLYIDDNYISELEFLQRDTWGELTLEAELQPGEHRFRVETGWGWMFLDFLKVSPKSSAPPEPQVCDSNINALGDQDKDGIPDCAEKPGYEYAGEKYYDLGARENQRDLFVEIDWMESSDPGVIPQKESLQRIVEAFEEEGFAIHFDTGNLYSASNTLDLENFNLGGGNQLDFYETLRLGNGIANNDKVIGSNEIIASNMNPNRRDNGAFHYMIFGNSQNIGGSAGSSGRAEIRGRVSIVTMGNWLLNRKDEENTNTLINYQAGTVMHEFGHNLGLRHGGYENKNFKPNYVSIMNYEYQLTGLPTIGDNEGDRLLERLGGSNCSGGLKNGPEQDYRNFKISYSHGLSIELNETSSAPLREADGFGQPGSGAIDFNCNGKANEELGEQKDLNKDDRYEVLSDYDDWSNIYMHFYETVTRDDTGSVPPSEIEYSVEKSPNAAFFERLRQLSNK